MHTPGPWWTTDDGIRDSGGYIAHTNSVLTYERQDERYAREIVQREADKKLIAAAPDLLEALKDALSIFEFGDDDKTVLAPKWVARARAAIAKATT